MKIKCTKIKYFADDSVKDDLPTKMTIEISDDFFKCIENDQDDVRDEVGMAIYNKTGYAAESFNFELLNT